MTLPAHRPAARQAVVEQSHLRLLERASAIGPATAALIRMQTQLKRHPEQTLRVTTSGCAMAVILGSWSDYK